MVLEINLIQFIMFDCRISVFYVLNFRGDVRLTSEFRAVS